MPATCRVAVSWPCLSSQTRPETQISIISFHGDNVKWVEMDTGEQFASQYLKQHALRAERSSKEAMCVSKPPDFRVFRKTELDAFCEAKHIQQEDLLEEQLNVAQPFVDCRWFARPNPV